MYWYRCVWVVVLMVSLSGCGAPITTYPVSGRVTLDGQPLPGGSILFEPVSNSAGYSSRGLIQEDGSFQLTTFIQHDGAPAGQYRVAVIPRAEELIDDPNYQPKNPFPEHLRSLERSGLRFEVREQSNDIDVRLSSQSPD